MKKSLLLAIAAFALTGCAAGPLVMGTAIIRDTIINRVAVETTTRVGTAAVQRAMAPSASVSAPKRFGPTMEAAHNL